MELEKSLNEYLEKIDTSLNPMTACERADSVKEIKSEMLELHTRGMSAEQILNRLGNPKELAKAYSGEAVAKSRGFSWRRLSAVIAFYSLAGFGGMFVLPITGLSGIGFMAAGALFPLAGVVKLAAHFMGYEMKEIGIHIGSYSASAIEFLPLSILMGAIVFVLGWLFWKLTLVIVQSMRQTKKKPDCI